MRAVQLVRWQAEPELREIEMPEPAPGEVLVKILGAGLCHSDIHVMEFPEGTVPWTLPFTLGHENAGVVAALGDGVTGFEINDSVLIYGPWGCGSCQQCARGAENLCLRAAGLAGRGGGLGFDGGLADYLVVPSPRLLVPIGDLDPAHAAPLTDAALSPYSAIKRELSRLTPGTTVVVIGVGGLGHVAVQILKALTAARSHRDRPAGRFASPGAYGRSTCCARRSRARAWRRPSGDGLRGRRRRLRLRRQPTDRRARGSGHVDRRPRKRRRRGRRVVPARFRQSAARRIREQADLGFAPGTARGGSAGAGWRDRNRGRISTA